MSLKTNHQCKQSDLDKSREVIQIIKMDPNCYNFTSQEVFVSDCNPSLISVIDDNQLVIVLESMASIRIYDLTVISEQNKPIITIPLTDANVKRLVHSKSGHYLALLADNNDFKSVRVYTNYWIEGQPIRVRPHGSLTSNQTKRLVDYHSRESMTIEVIELKDLSISNDCQDITCCQSNADLFVVCGYRILLFGHQNYKLSTNLIQTDFLILLDIRLEWIATSLASVGPYIALMSKTHASLLHLELEYDRNLKNDKKIDEIEVPESSEVLDDTEWDFDDYSKTLRLPTLFDSESQYNNMKSHCQRVVGPVDQSLCCKFGLTMNHSNIDSPICRASLRVLLCQYFDSSEPLIDVQLISYNRETILSNDPLNASKEETKSSENSLKDNTDNDMIGSALLLVTKKCLYFYNIFKRIELMQTFALSDKIRSYSFNKSDDSLHLITDNGLESYGLNFMHIFVDSKPKALNFKMNFRTFLNIEFILNTKYYLLLVTESQNELRTIYSLRKPSLRHISEDVNAFLNESQLEFECKHSLMTYLNAILYFNCVLNEENDYQMKCFYRKITIDLCNLIYDCDSVEAKKSTQSLIRSAKLRFSHLINYKLNYDLIFDFIAEKLESGDGFDINKCDISLLKGFLSVVSVKDLTMFCRFCLSQTLDSDVRLLIIGLLLTVDSKDCHWPPITLAKLLLDNNDIERANNYMTSLSQTNDLSDDFILNYKLIFRDKSFAKYFETCVPNIFYKLLLTLAQTMNSVQLIYQLLQDFDLRVRHNFLNMAYNKCRSLVSQDLILILVEANVRLLTDGTAINERYLAVESIERPSLEWMDELPPHHRQSQCFCVKCNQIVSDLYTLLCDAINEDVIKSDINNIISRIDAQNECLFTARLLSMDAISGLRLVLNDFPHIIFPYIKHVCDSNTTLLKRVISLFASQMDNIKDIDFDSHIGIALSFALNQLALILTPEELIELMPRNWKEFAISFVRKSIINMQSNVLKQHIIDSALSIKADVV